MTAPVILSIEAYDYFAAELAAHLGCPTGRIERDTFPDGERHLRVLDEVNDRDVVLVGGTISDAATLELYDLANAVVENGAATLTLIVPWFGYSTAERAAQRGEAVMAKTRARLLSSIPSAKLGNSVLLLDLHTDGIPYYFEGAIHTVHVHAKPLIEQIVRELGGDGFVVGSTDAGRAKWVESLAYDLGVPAAFVYKKRLSPTSTAVSAVTMSFSGQTVVVYDDMIRSGSSILNAARAYRDAGAGSIIAIATHGVFPGDALARLVDSGLFRHIACTDSHVNARRLAASGKLLVKSVAPLFIPFLRRTN
jgi:ribose-phosphate pyrophosphokinase